MPAFRLGEAATRAGYRVLGHDRVGSTNTEAMHVARAGDPDKFWATALEQTEGRGRRGRQWASQYGNLAASVFVELPPSVAEPGLLGFVAGVSLAGAIETLLAAAGNPIEVNLKWPNDVLAGGKKLVGILLEAERLPNGNLAVVVGMGVNVVAAPEGLPFPATSLAALGLDVSAQDLFETLSARFATHFETWNFGLGSADVMARWRLYAAGLGGHIGVVLDGRKIEGRFETVDEQGRLIVRTPSGVLERITAGDVYFGGARSLKRDDELRESDRV